MSSPKMSPPWPMPCSPLARSNGGMVRKSKETRVSFRRAASRRISPSGALTKWPSIHSNTVVMWMPRQSFREATATWGEICSSVRIWSIGYFWKSSKRWIPGSSRESFSKSKEVLSWMASSISSGKALV